jgi:hypothetical protein
MKPWHVRIEKSKNQTHESINLPAEHGTFLSFNDRMYKDIIGGLKDRRGEFGTFTGF